MSFSSASPSPPKHKIKLLGLATACALIAATAPVSVRAAPNPVVVGKARFSVLTPHCVRIESAGADGKFVDLPSLFAINRGAKFNDFKLKKEGGATIIDTGAMRLKYAPDGQVFSAKNLSATIKCGTNWTPGAKNTGNLGGTLRTLDGVKAAVPVLPGVVSRDGWALIDNSRDPLLVGDWVRARPKNAGSDWYLFGYGHNYRAALKSLTTVGDDVPLPRKNLLGTWYSRYWPISSQEYREISQNTSSTTFPSTTWFWTWTGTAKVGRAGVGTAT